MGNKLDVLLALTTQEIRSFMPGAEIPVNWSRLELVGMSSGDWMQVLDERRPRAIVTGWQTPRFPEFETVILPPTYVCHLTGSVRNVLPRSWIQHGVLVSNWGTTINYTIAEHAVLLILGALRGVPLWRKHMDTGGRVPLLATKSLRGKRVGIHGFGGIARELVKLLEPYGARVSAYSEGVPEALFEKQGVRCCASLPELVSSSEILVELEALTERTKGSITVELLRLLPDDAVFVNVGRGGVVNDEPGLAELASEGRIRLASDVFQREPLPADSPLRDVEAALLSPHIAGPTADTYPILGDLAMANLRRYFAGESVEGQVTLEIFDRST